MSIHDERMLSLLVHLAGNFIAREAGRQTLITPTRAELGKDKKSAIIYVSVFPESEALHALEYLSRQGDAFREYMKKEARLSFLPRITFVFDEGEQNRQHLDDLSRNLHSGGPSGN